MNILYISHKIPYPLSDGGKLRVFNHIRHLSKKNSVVSLSFIESKYELDNISELRKYCRVETVVLSKLRSLINSFFGLFSRKPLRVWYLKDKRFGKKAKDLSRWADLIIVQALRMTQYCFYDKKIILDIVDTPSLQIRRALKHGNLIWKLIWNLELPRIRKYEKMICKIFQNIIVASKADKKALGKGVVLKNGTEISSIRRKNVDENNIVFLGNMKYQPNIDGVDYFVREIFPLIRRKVKSAKFYIIGKNPEKVRKYASKDIIVTGFVEDLNEYFSKCKVFVAPLRIGSGIQNKVLEALNNKIPVVLSSIVNKGIEGKDGKELIVADGAKDFAEKVIKVLRDKKIRESLSSNGKKFLKKNYSWYGIYEKLDDIIKSVR